MSLRALVAARGGDLYQSGLRANVPAPGHSSNDRSVSLLLDGDRLVIHGFGAADWREVRDHLRGLGLIDAEGRLAGGGLSLVRSSSARPDASARIEAAVRLWEATIPIADGDLCARHLLMRGIETPPDRLADLRRHPAAPVSVFAPASPTRPALVAAIRDPGGRLCAVELVYLEGDGRCARLRLPRKTVGAVPGGAAVRLSPAGAVMVVGEGVMTTLSASARFSLPGWALLSAGNLCRWTSPERVRRVIVAADRGPAGEAAAVRLCRRLRAQGVAASMRQPPTPFGDWNDVAVGRGKAEEEGRGGAPARRG